MQLVVCSSLPFVRHVHVGRRMRLSHKRDLGALDDFFEMHSKHEHAQHLRMRVERLRIELRQAERELHDFEVTH